MTSLRPNEPIWQQIIQTRRLEGRPIILFDTIDSTNSRALALAGKGAESGTILIAQTQSKGRGRLGRSWQSPRGTGLYFSIITRPQLPPADLSKITLAVGLALRNGVAKACGIKALLKWPNDLLFEQKKLAGILTETNIDIEGKPTVVIGIGLNVNTPATAFPAELANHATSICIAADRYFDKGVVLTVILHEIEREIERLANNEFKGILADWRTHDATYGKWLTWITPRGKKISGISLGPDEDGLLHIRDATGASHTILSGDLKINRKQ